MRADRLALGEADAAALGLPTLAADLALVLAVEALDLVGRELVEERRKVVGRVGAERVGGYGREQVATQVLLDDNAALLVAEDAQRACVELDLLADRVGDGRPARAKEGGSGRSPSTTRERRGGRT